MTRNEKIEELLNIAKNVCPLIEDGAVEYTRKFLHLIPDDVPLPKLQTISNDLIELQWSPSHPLQYPKASVDIYSDGETFVNAHMESGKFFYNFLSFDHDKEEIFYRMRPFFQDAKITDE